MLKFFLQQVATSIARHRAAMEMARFLLLWQGLNVFHQSQSQPRADAGLSPNYLSPSMRGACYILQPLATAQQMISADNRPEVVLPPGVSHCPPCLKASRVLSG